MKSSLESLEIESVSSISPSHHLQEPVLPWLNNRSNSSLSSDIHTMKGYTPCAVKTYKRWTGHKLWLISMNCLVRIHTTLYMSNCFNQNEIIVVFIWISYTCIGNMYLFKT